MTRLFDLKLAALAAGIVLPLTMPALAQDAVDLRMAIWSANDAHLKLFNSIADDYKKTHPNVSVKFDSLAFDGYTTTLTTQIAGGTAPDMAWILETTAPDFVSSGALLPLSTTCHRARCRCGHRMARSTPIRSRPRPSPCSSTTI